MPVTSGATSTEANLNNTNPAAPSGAQNVQWQAAAAVVDPNDPNFEVRDISAYVPNYLGRKISLETTGGTDLTFTLTAISTWTDVAWVIKKIDSGAGKVKIVPHAGDPNIEGATEYDLPNQYDFVELFTDGTSIYIIGSNTA